MLKRGLKGKDMGRRGRSDENDEVYVTWLSAFCVMVFRACPRPWSSLALSLAGHRRLA